MPLQSELREWSNSPPEGAVLEFCEPVTSWGILIQGPETAGNLYNDELFRYVQTVILAARFKVKSPAAVRQQTYNAKFRPITDYGGLSDAVCG